jgi:hypothetical protein
MTFSFIHVPGKVPRHRGIAVIFRRKAAVFFCKLYGPAGWPDRFELPGTGDSIEGGDKP